MARRTEWRLEPVDANGDIIDPLFYGTQAAAQCDVVDVLAKYPDAEYVDLCSVTRTGNDREGVTDQVYDYATRYYRDGTTAPLRTLMGETPEVAV